MKIEYNNLYTHFVLTTYQRMPIISEKHRSGCQLFQKNIGFVLKNT